MWLKDMIDKVKANRAALDAAAEKRRIDSRAWDLIRQGWPPSSAVDVARNEARSARRAGLQIATAAKC